MEGEAANVSSAYHDWEIALWKGKDGEKDVAAYDVKGLRPGRQLEFLEYGMILTAGRYYPNSEAYSEGQVTDAVLNARGSRPLRRRRWIRNPRKISGCALTVSGSDQDTASVILYGGEDNPVKITKGGTDYFLQLRRKSFPLPFLLRLKDFTVEWYPNTELARSYKSLVEITPAAAGRARS